MPPAAWCAKQGGGGPREWRARDGASCANAPNALRMVRCRADPSQCTAIRPGSRRSRVRIARAVTATSTVDACRLLGVSVDELVGESSDRSSGAIVRAAKEKQLVQLFRKLSPAKRLALLALPDQ